VKANLIIKIVLSVIATLIIVQTLLFLTYTDKVTKSRFWVVHTYKVIEELQSLYGNVEDSEIAQLGFIITKNTEFQNQLKGIVGEKPDISLLTNDMVNKADNINTHIGNIRYLTQDNLPQEKRLDDLENTIKQHLEFHNTAGSSGISPHLSSIRIQIDKMKQSELSLLDARQKVNQSEESKFLYFLGASSILTYLALFGIVYLLMSARNSQKEEWIRVGQTELSDILRQGNSIELMLKNVVAYLGHYLDAQVVAFYVNNEDSTLQLIASYAYTKRKGISNKIKPGEGLVGQVAIEKSPISVTEIPDNYIRIKSGIGEAVPKNILVYPIKIGDELKGVIEFGTFTKFNDNAVTLLERVSEYIALSIREAQISLKRKELLDQTQKQSIELQQQQEELKATNEELEQQTEELKQSQAALKQQSEELQASNEELEEKTQSLELQRVKIEDANSALQLKQKEIEEKAGALELSGKYKSEFLANMSHELRTPLNSLLILSEILLENNLNNLTEDQMNSIQVINQGGKDLLNLINDILDISKVEAGKLETNIETVTFTELEHSLKNQFQPLAKKKNIEFLVKREEGVPESIQSDKQRIEQITKNLISNAIKFTEHGTVTLSIHKPSDKVKLQNKKCSKESCVAISVCDTGIGIAKDKQHTVFEAFQQGDGSISRKYGGTGLGLTISSKLATMLGGEIQLESALGKGATFTLYLPEKLVSANGQTEISQKQTVEQKTFQHENEFLEPEAEKVKSLLIIEDDNEFCKIITKLAQEKEYQCTTLHNGKSAIKYAIKNRPSAIILDLGLPDIDGLLVLEQLKHNQYTRHIPVHVISCRDEKNVTLKMGALGSLLKPVSKTQLEEAFTNIEEILKNPIKTVLVVEDNNLSQKAITKLISSDIVKVETVCTGQEALEKIKSQSFDCIILDLKLPDMSGVTVLEKLSQEDANHTPIIVYTGKDLSQEEYREINQYATSVILKVSNSPERLLDEVTLFLHSINAKMTDEQKNTIKKLEHHDEVLVGKQILLVDDDMRNLYALSSALRAYGLEVTMAANGKNALEKLDDLRCVYDLIVMDIMMPEMDGYEAITHIRELDDYKTVPIIALTAKAMSGDEEKCINVGASDYLTKPVDINLLISMIRIWVIQNEKRNKTA